MYAPSRRFTSISDLPLNTQRDLLQGELHEIGRDYPQVRQVIADRQWAATELGDPYKSWFDMTMCWEIWDPHSVVGPRGLRYFCGMSPQGSILSIGNGSGDQSYASPEGYDVHLVDPNQHMHTDWQVLQADLLLPPAGRLDVELALGRGMLGLVNEEGQRTAEASLRLQYPSRNSVSFSEGSEVVVFDQQLLSDVYSFLKDLRGRYGTVFEETYQPDNVVPLAA